MYGDGSGRGPWFGGGRGRGFWLLPLVIGFGLGALLFGGGPRWGYRDYGPGYGERWSAPAAPAEPQTPQAAPQAPDAPRGEAWGRRGERFGYGPDHRHGGFFPFGGMKLLIPLLLIGAGAWLLSGRGRGRGGPGGPGGWRGRPDSNAPGATGAQYSAPDAPPSPRPEPPSTGETRRL